MKAFCVLRSDGEKGRRRKGTSGKAGARRWLERARMAERFGGGAAPAGHQHAGTDGHQARRDSGEPKGLRRAQKRAQGEVREERQGSREPRKKRGTRHPGAPMPPPGAAAKSPRRSALPARGSGAKGDGGRSGAGEYEKSRSPALVFCSRGPAAAECTGNGGSELLRAPRLPSLGKERLREFSPARYPAAPCPGATRPRRARGESGAGGAGPPGSRSPRCSARPPPRPRGSPSS